MMSEKYIMINEFLSGFDETKIKGAGELRNTLIAELLLFASLRSYINKMLREAKVDRQISKFIEDDMQKKVTVRVINHDRIFSFCDQSDTVWLSSALYHLLNVNEVVAICLSEANHGKLKMKRLYDWYTKQKYPRILKTIRTIMAKKALVNIDALNQTRIYMMAYLFYIHYVKNPVPALYQFSYNDYTIRAGFGDHYDSALRKINKQIRREKPSQIIKKLEEKEKENPKSIKTIEKQLIDDATNSSDNIGQQASKGLRKFGIRLSNMKIVQLTKKLFK